MRQLRVVEPSYCDEMFAVGHISRVNGHGTLAGWVNSDAEYFAATENGDPSHLHIYNYAPLVEAFKSGSVKLPSSVVTVSYPSSPWKAPPGTKPMDLYVRRYVNPNQIALFA